MEDLICEVCHKKTQELHGFNYSRIKMCNKCYILHLESQCENLRSYILNSFSENDREKFLKECCKGKLFDDVLKTFKPAISNAELEQELAELKEKAIVPKFKVGQEVYYYHIARNKIYLGLVEDIQYFATRSGIFYRIPNLQRDYFWIREDELFATEKEAQAKLKEMNGNE